MLKYSFVISLVVLICPPALSVAAGDGPQADKEWLYKNVFARGNNLYGDAIPISAPERLLRKAWKELTDLDDAALANYAAVFYIFPEGEKPIRLYGALAPAGDALADIPRAVMHIRVDAKNMVRIGALPENTLVYGVDGSGNKAWFPLRFFEAHSIHPGYLTSEAIYAYTYRPSAKMVGRYGGSAWYLDAIGPERIDAARLGLEDMITLLGSGVPEDLARIGWFSRAAFYAPILGYAEDHPELTRIPYTMTLYVDEDGPGGTIDVKVPFRPAYSFSGDSVKLYLNSPLFEALGSFREAVARQFEAENDYKASDRFRGFELSVTHTSKEGYAKLTRINTTPGNGGPAFSITVQAAEGTLIVSNIEGGDRIVMDAGEEAIKQYLIRNGNQGIPAWVDAPPPEDWKAVYDTAGYGSGEPRSPSARAGESDIVIGASFKYYEVDVQPTFRGGDFNSFCQWVYSRIDNPALGTGEYYDRTVVDFIIDENGKLAYIREVESSWEGLLLSVAALLEESGDDWTPGSVAGLPVKVTYRLEVAF